MQNPKSENSKCPVRLRMDARPLRVAKRVGRKVQAGGQIPNSKTAAFTIIELLVAVTLFVVLVGMAAGGFIRVLRTQRAIAALMEADDNVSSALEQMVREMRTGYGFSKISDSEIQFVNAHNIVVRYRLNEASIGRGTYDPNLVLTYKKITADNIKISNLNINLLGGNPGDGFPPRITVSLSVSIANTYLKGTSINIQTTVSSRALKT